MDVENGSVLTKATNNDGGYTDGSTISFHSITYTLESQKCCSCIPIPCLKKTQQQILYDLTGIFKAGMNAILGPTGSGKSSLLDILADRKDRRGLEGQVLIDGQPQTSDFKYRVGYVVQDDIISGEFNSSRKLDFLSEYSSASKCQINRPRLRL